MTRWGQVVWYHSTFQKVGPFPLGHHAPETRNTVHSSVKAPLFIISHSYSSQNPRTGCLSPLLQSFIQTHRNKKYLYIIKFTAIVMFQFHVCEVKGNPLTSRQPDQINALFVMCIVIRPVRGNDNALAFCVCASTSWVSYNTQRQFVH